MPWRFTSPVLYFPTASGNGQRQQNPGPENYIPNSYGWPNEVLGMVYNYSGIHRIFQLFQNGGTGIRQSLWDIYMCITLTCSTAPDNRCELVDVSRLYN